MPFCVQRSRLRVVVPIAGTQAVSHSSARPLRRCARLREHAAPARHRERRAARPLRRSLGDSRAASAALGAPGARRRRAGGEEGCAAAKEGERCASRPCADSAASRAPKGNTRQRPGPKSTSCCCRRCRARCRAASRRSRSASWEEYPAWSLTRHERAFGLRSRALAPLERALSPRLARSRAVRPGKAADHARLDRPAAPGAPQRSHCAPGLGHGSDGPRRLLCS